MVFFVLVCIIKKTEIKDQSMKLILSVVDTADVSMMISDNVSGSTSVANATCRYSSSSTVDNGCQEGLSNTLPTVNLSSLSTGMERLGSLELEEDEECDSVCCGDFAFVK
eukprot:gene7790-8636_t